MKKLSITQNIANVFEMKQLQKEVRTLCQKEQGRNDEVTSHQSEEKRVTGIVHPVQQGLQQLTHVLEEVPLEHISFDHMEQLEKKAEEVKEEVS